MFCWVQDSFLGTGDVPELSLDYSTNLIATQLSIIRLVEMQSRKGLWCSLTPRSSPHPLPDLSGLPIRETFRYYIVSLTPRSSPPSLWPIRRHYNTSNTCNTSVHSSARLQFTFHPGLQRFPKKFSLTNFAKKMLQLLTDPFCLWPTRWYFLPP